MLVRHVWTFRHFAAVIDDVACAASLKPLEAFAAIAPVGADKPTQIENRATDKIARMCISRVDDISNQSGPTR